MNKKKKDKSLGLKIWNISVLILLLGLVSFIGYKILIEHASIKDLFNDIKHTIKSDNKKNNNVIPKVVPKLKIMDLDSKTRPIGVMVDNEKGAWPQAGLQDAYLIYEIIVEGGESRFYALYKDKNTAMIGPARSARHYFVDYAMENDAIYTHFGYSPQAMNDIKTFGVNNISGTDKDGKAFWREKVITTNWQNCFTSIERLKNRAKEKNYRMTSSVEPVLNYSIEEINLSLAPGAILANTVTIYYSKGHYVTYEYDATNKVYKRSQYNKPQVDRVTGLQYTTKNIITYGVYNYPLNDGSGSGRQGLNNIGNGTGYYITDGYAIPITWSKTARDSQTIYKDSSGSELKVNDGNTFINIQPLNKTLTIQ